MNNPAKDLQSKITRGLLTFSALWSIAVGIWMAATPLYISEIFAVADVGSKAEPLVNQYKTSFYGVQGAWGIFILVLFALLFSSSAILLRRGRPGLAALAGLLAIVLTYLAGFSIGPAYLPAALTTLAAVLLITLHSIRRATQDMREQHG